MTNYIVSSGIVNSITLRNGDTMSVFNSGTATDIAVTSGGTMSAYLGGVTSSANIKGGTEIVSNGGSSYNTSCSMGGVEVVSGGISYGTAIGGGSLESVYGGTAISTIVANGGFLNLTGAAIGTVVSADGSFNLLGGTASNTIINCRSYQTQGFETILGNAIASGTTIIGGVQYVSAGTAIDTTLVSTSSGFGYQDVYANGTARSTTIYAHNEQFVDGGLAIYTTINAGSQTVGYAGAASETTIIGGGIQTVSGGAYYTAVRNGDENVIRNGISYDSRITSGGTENVTEGGMSSKTTIMSGGLETLSAFDGYHASSTDTKIVSGGSEMINAGGVSRHTIIDGGRVEVGSSGQINDGIIFSGSGGELVIDHKKIPQTMIKGFTAGDSIQLAMVDYASSDTVSVNAPGIVIISAGGTEYSLNIAGATVGETDFTFGPGSILTKTAPTQMTFQRPPVGSSSGFRSGWTGAGPVVVSCKSDSDLKILGGTQSVASSGHFSGLHNPLPLPLPTAFAVSVTAQF